jgi:hypothetical protein
MSADVSKSGKRGDAFRVRYDRGDVPPYFICPICGQGWKSHTRMKTCQRNCIAERAAK